MKINSIRFKASILYTTILCVILIVFSGILFSVTRHILYRDIDEKLRIKAGEIINIINSYEALKKTTRYPQHLINQLLGLEDRTRLIVDEMWRSDVRALNLKNDYIHIFNIRGRPVIKSLNFEEDIAALFKEQMPVSLNHVIFKNLRDKDRHLRAISLPFSYGQKHLLVIQVGTPLDSVNKILRRLMVFIGVSVLFILGLTSFLGSFFARRILKPVMHVTELADDISYTDLNRRIAEMEVDDEMKHLIRSFNSMIERLEHSFQHVNEFSSQVAHELKTPVAIIRGEMELALSETRDVEEYKRVLETSLEEIDRLIRIIKDLLLLARLDYNPQVFVFERIDLGGFLNEISEHARMLANEKEIAVGLDVPSVPVRIQGDRTHLSRLFLNLVNNAIKFTPEKGRIAIALSARDRQARVAFSDTGIGIAPDHLEKVFQKFYRIRHDGAGSGLGLNIARSIARAHQGDIIVESRPGRGTTFTVTFPQAP